MKSAEFPVRCEFLRWDRKVHEGGGGAVDIVYTPRCTCEGAPNYDPDLDRPFADKCSECEHNRWPSESCG
jgi:hypothetical protein